LPPDYQERIRRHPQPISGFNIVDEIGRGGMGIVYLAVRETDSAVVALKTITPATVAEPADVERFLREAAILRELDHPHIVAFRDIGRSNQLLYFAMDYVAGCDASRLLQDHPGPLSIARVVRLVCQLLDALEYAHARGFIHRDIKPANLLVTRETPETVKLTDFGLARTYQTSRLSGLTLMGDVGGTIPYMAPEQITNYRDSKPPVDQYAAAATLYHLLTRKHLYDFPRDVSRRLILILQHDPIPIRARRADVPEELAAIIHRGLLRNPQDRYASVGAFRDALLPFRDAGE
jgi:serine/threonine-protein kinase